MNNVKNVESEMITSALEIEIKKLIKKAQMEVLEVCAKEYNFDINMAMLLIGAGGKDPKERKGKKERAKKAVKEMVERNSMEGVRKSKGRPKNPEKVVEVEETDNLFEQLVKLHIETEVALGCSVVIQTKEDKKEEESAEKEERSMMSGAEKETKVVNKLEAKEAEKQLKEQEKATAKLAKLEAIASANAAKEQEKLAKLEATASANAAKEQEKLAKLEAKEAEKQAKEQAKLAKTSAKASAKTESGSDTDTSSKSKKEKNTKVSAKKTKETAERVAKEATDVENQAKMNDMSKKLEVAAVNPVAVVAASAPATLKVKSFKYEGATYFREKNTGAIYDKETNDHLGQWNEATQKIDFLEAEEELEEEEESDGESSDEEEEEEEEESA